MPPKVLFSSPACNWTWPGGHHCLNVSQPGLGPGTVQNFPREMLLPRDKEGELKTQIKIDWLVDGKNRRKKGREEKLQGLSWNGKKNSGEGRKGFPLEILVGSLFISVLTRCCE